MAAAKSSAKTTAAPKKKKGPPPLTEEEQRQLEEQARQTRERRAETQLELAKLFLAKDKPDIALRRLREVAAEHAGTQAAAAAQDLIKRWR